MNINRDAVHYAIFFILLYFHCCRYEYPTLKTVRKDPQSIFIPQSEIQVPNSYKTTDETVVSYILIFILSDKRTKNKRL